MMNFLHSIGHDWQGIVDKFFAAAKRPLLTIIGPTASGKTSFSLLLSNWLQGRGSSAEIVNADSRQCYEGFDIGTAKITALEMQGIPHHLFSVLPSTAECSVAWYQQEATKVIADIHDRGAVPILVGGSMLYVSALIDGFVFLPASDAAMRAQLEQEYDADSGERLYRKLQDIDPVSASTFSRQNKRYVVRALEVYALTGNVKSSQLKKHGGYSDVCILGLKPSRDVLSARILARVREMFDQGWVEEVEELLKKGVRVADPGMKSIGYPDIVYFLAKKLDPNSALYAEEKAELLRSIASKTRAYAKRHQTWWKKDQRVHWLNIAEST